MKIVVMSFSVISEIAKKNGLDAVGEVLPSHWRWERKPAESKLAEKFCLPNSDRIHFTTGRGNQFIVLRNGQILKANPSKE